MEEVYITIRNLFTDFKCLYKQVLIRYISDFPQSTSHLPDLFENNPPLHRSSGFAAIYKLPLFSNPRS